MLLPQSVPKSTVFKTLWPQQGFLKASNFLFVFNLNVSFTCVQFVKINQAAGHLKVVCFYLCMLGLNKAFEINWQAKFGVRSKYI